MENKIEITGILEQGYGIIPKKIMQAKDLDIYDKAILAYMLSFSGHGTTCWPGYTKIQEDLNISKDRICKTINNLCKKGYISKEKLYPNEKLKQNNKYKLLFFNTDWVRVTEHDVPPNRISCPAKQNVIINNNINNNNINNSKELLDESKNDSSKDILENFSSEKIIQNIPSEKEKKPLCVSVKKQKEEYPENKYLKFWNEQPNLQKHKRTSKLYKECSKMFALLEMGEFGKHYRKINQAHLVKNELDQSVFHKKYTEQEIMTAIERFNGMFEPGCNDYKTNKKLSKSCLIWLYNNITGTSIAMKNLNKSLVPFISTENPKDPKVLELYRRELFSNKKFGPEAEAQFIRIVNGFITKYRAYREEVEQYSPKSEFKNYGFFDIHIKYFLEKHFSKENFGLTLVGAHWAWIDFMSWLLKRYNINFDVKPETKMFLKEDYLRKVKEAEERDRVEAEYEEENRKWRERRDKEGGNMFQKMAMVG